MLDLYHCTQSVFCTPGVIPCLGQPLLSRPHRLDLELVWTLTWRRPGLDTEAQWYMASACTVSRMAVGTLMDECNFLGFKGVGPGEEDEEEETDMEAVNQEVVEQEVAKLWKEVLEPWPLDNEM